MGYGTIDFANQSVDSKDFYNIEADDGSNYCFVKAVILDKDEKYPENLGTTLSSLRRQRSGQGPYASYSYIYTYNELNAAGTDYVLRQETFNPEEQTLYFVYAKDELTEIRTINNEDAGITMRMIDYANPAQAYGGDSLDNELGGQYTEEGYGSGRVKQGLLKNVLQDGYPVTSGENTSNKEDCSLKSLFSSETQRSTSVTRLFSQDIYDETGYYEYSSFENYAYLVNGR